MPLRRERGSILERAPPFTVAAAVTDRKECNFSQPQPKQELSYHSKC